MAPGGRVKNILIVDDTDVIRRLLSELLIGEGYQVFTACDGEEAISVIQSESIDLVFCDVHMPRLNGLETLKRSRKLNPDLLFVMTDSLPDELSEAARKIGAIDCIAKPFDIEEVRSIVVRAEGFYEKVLNAHGVRS
jgi:two-component system response regulator (stage 0 sporulation protein F)